MSVGHLARRFVGSFSHEPPSPADVTWVRSLLLPAEWAMWERLVPADQRHTIAVARRFVGARPEATRAEVAGALLHDIGKIECGLGTVGRVAATVVGPRSARFRQYHDHEAIGARWCTEAGSDPVTIALVEGAGPAAAALRAADDV